MATPAGDSSCLFRLEAFLAEPFVQQLRRDRYRYRRGVRRRSAKVTATLQSNTAQHLLQLPDSLIPWCTG